MSSLDVDKHTDAESFHFLQPEWDVYGLLLKKLFRYVRRIG